MKIILKKYFQNTKILDNFLKRQKTWIKRLIVKTLDTALKLEVAIIFDEGGIHKGSKPSLNDRMVLRYLYSLKKKGKSMKLICGIVGYPLKKT